MFDGDDDFYLLNKNNSDIVNSSSPVFRSNLSSNYFIQSFSFLAMS